MAGATFRPLYDCDGGDDPADGSSPLVQPTVVKISKHPYSAAIDSDFAGSPDVPLPQSGSQLSRLALGENITQTPEYRAANLPPYNEGAGPGFLHYFGF